MAGAGYRVLAPDQRGYSIAARPAKVADYAMPNLVADVMAMASAMGMETFDLVGHDWGGMVAWQVGTHHAERVRSLNVLSTPHPLALQHAQLGGDPEQTARAGRMDLYLGADEPERLLLGDDGLGGGLLSLLTMGGLTMADAGVYVETMRQEGAMKAALHWYRAMDRSDLFELTPVTVPTMYIWSTRDEALGRAAAEATRECVSGPYRFMVLDAVSATGSPRRLAPHQLNQLLLSHLSAT